MTRTLQHSAGQGDWVLCNGCQLPVYGKRLARNLAVCPGCGQHLPVSAPRRLVQLADDGQYESLQPVSGSIDPLEFVDTEPYVHRLARARARTGLDEAAICARITIEGQPVIAAVMDFRFMGGSLGCAVGESITRAAETALAERTPLLIITASGGARMQEGVLSLMQMAKTSAALGQLDEAGVLTISLVTDPTFGGVAASFATLADVIIAEPGARLGFAGRRVIEQTIRRQLPPRFQTAEFLLERGFIDLVVPRPLLRRRLAGLLRAGRPETAVAGPLPDRWQSARAEVVITDPAALPRSDPWHQVRQARDLTRPTALEYISRVFAEFYELHGDRVSGDCSAVVGGVARLGHRAVVVIGQQKGHDATELNQRNFGMPNPAGYRKAARLMRLADKLHLPVVTLIDTPGAYPGADAEERGQAVAIAESLRLMASLRVPVLAVVIGEGGSGGALALAVANRVLMFSGSVYSVISPEGCAAIIWKDVAAAPRAAEALGLHSRDLLRLGIVDGVLPEPEGGTGAAPAEAAATLRVALVHALGDLSGLTAAQLRSHRQARFRQFGSAATVEAELRTIREEAI